MGQHAWLMSATVLTELLIIFKFGRGQFNQPFPTPVKLFAGTGLVVLISYPIYKVSTPLWVLLNIPGLHVDRQFGFPKLASSASTPSSPIRRKRPSLAQT